jgi:hypothetical protein
MTLLIMLTIQISTKSQKVGVLKEKKKIFLIRKPKSLLQLITCDVAAKTGGAIQQNNQQWQGDHFFCLKIICQTALSASLVLWSRNDFAH